MTLDLESYILPASSSALVRTVKRRDPIDRFNEKNARAKGHWIIVGSGRNPARFATSEQARAAAVFMGSSSPCVKFIEGT